MGLTLLIIDLLIILVIKVCLISFWTLEKLIFMILMVLLLVMILFMKEPIENAQNIVSHSKWFFLTKPWNPKLLMLFGPPVKMVILFHVFKLYLLKLVGLLLHTLPHIMPPLFTKIILVLVPLFK